MTSAPHPPWHARGLLFENCNCTVVCPGHTHFSQNCTHERCLGFWAVHVDAGAWADVDLAGTRAVLVYDSPRRMIDGGWTQSLVLDAGASAAQREALDRILTGRAGGPWEVLARFVGEWLPTRVEPVEMEDTDALKRVSVAGVVEGLIEPIRGRDRTRPVTFANMFNQIHAPEQVIARGSARYTGPGTAFENQASHGLWSRFEWRVAASGGNPAAGTG